MAHEERNLDDELPRSPASERNREPILSVLREQLADSRSVLEIGSGTGQHAVHFGAALPRLTWQTSDLPASHAGIRAWIAASGLANVLPPLALDADDASSWPDTRYDAAFTANTFHIMSWSQVQSFFAHLPRVLAPRAKLVVYGPFNYDGRFTSPSNAAFDASLKAADPRRGIRDIEAVHALAAGAGLVPVDDFAMPANNRCVVWTNAAT